MLGRSLVVTGRGLRGMNVVRGFIIRVGKRMGKGMSCQYVYFRRTAALLYSQQDDLKASRRLQRCDRVSIYTFFLRE